MDSGGKFGRPAHPFTKGASMFLFAFHIRSFTEVEPQSWAWGIQHPVLLALIAGLTIGVLIWFLIRAFLRQSLPQRKGESKLDGLIAPVTVERDKFGVPTILAENLLDALYAQGFVQVQDRLWQMELNRRIGAGRLAEIFGTQALSADIFLRRLGLRKAAESDLAALKSEERRWLQAFCDGVNAGIQGTKTWPVEFRLLKIEPEPWEPLDSLTWVQVMSMDLCSNWEQELLRGRILEKLGPQGAELLHLFAECATFTVPPGAKGPEVMKGLWDLYDEAKAYLPNGGFPGGSNAWVVSGQRTKSGRALLANDPHLVGRVPSIWYESRLKCPEFDVIGASFPGVPFVIIGANRRVAWGVTNSYADTQDLYLERFHQNNPFKYETEDGWQRVWSRDEVIKVKNQKDHVERVESTRHGPVLFRDQAHGLALKWKNAEPSRPINTLFRMNSAGTTGEFKEALRAWQAPSSNFVFADVDGNIGYVMAGHVPIRRSGTGLTPVPGWNGEYEWEGEIPFEGLPQVDNPECGYIATANNPVVGQDFPYHITWDWMGPARAQRIEAMILQEELHDISSFQGMQVDTFCSLGVRFVNVCREMLFIDAAAKDAMEFLNSWDGDGYSESGEMALYEVTLLAVTERIVKSVLGDELGKQFLGQSHNPVAVMAGHTGRYTSWVLQVLEQPDKYYRLSKLGRDLPSVETLVEEALSEAYQELGQAFGRNPIYWEWGKLHRLQFKHPLGINPVAGFYLNSPAGSAGGDTDTVFQTAMNPQSPYGSEAWCPSFRQIVELCDEPEYYSVLPTGQSGHPASRNYMDQFHLWCAGELRPMSSGVKSRLRLVP
jgi:penicillin G amidase